MSEQKAGFLAISDVSEIHKVTPIFIVPKDEPNDIMERMNEQTEKVTFDFRLGREYFLSGDQKPRLLTDAYPWLTIESGQFAQLTSFEQINLPQNLVAFISLRFRKKRGGLINVSGFHIDPGYNGIIVFSVFNAGPRPVSLKLKDDMFLITFCKTTKQLKFSTTPKLHLDNEDFAQLVEGKKLSLQSLDERVNKIEIWRNITTVGLTAGIAIIGILVALWNSGGQS